MKIRLRNLSQYEIDEAIRYSTEDAYWSSDNENGDRYIVRARLDTNELLYVSLAPAEKVGEWKLITAFVPSREGYGYD